ncbi:hypothetical protein VZT92_023012 [Zoarces viviparus]|uniref:Uncharacterized protein n=1 Tax=Zoarces viviparus TaxID=48416 RepID=A0AAW1E798_ZOAVI
MKAAIDDLLNKRRGQKDMLKLVDQDYAALVHNSFINPPPPVHTLTQASIEKIVQNIMEKQQQQQQQQQSKEEKTQTKPEPRYENDGSSIHVFYQQGPFRYLYCSTKVFKAYGAEEKKRWEVEKGK